MAVTSHAYPKNLIQIATKAVSLTADTFTAGLCTGDASAWTTGTVWGYQYVTAVIGAYTEVTTGGGYTSGYANRQALTTFTFTQQSATNDNITYWTCTNPSPISFGASTTITARSMFLNNKTAGGASSDTNSMVMVIIDFGQNVSSTAGAYTYTVSSTAASPGLLYFTSS